MSRLNSIYWDEKYRAQQTGWDAGAPTTPLVEFFKTLSNFDLRILIPGCGRAYEGELLHKLGFTNVVLLDVAATAQQEFLQRVPSFPAHNYVIGDFFSHHGSYDLILEQTFFCALEPALRPTYAKKMAELLAPNGQLVGLLFTFPLTSSGPPFGGSLHEYRSYFAPYFDIKKLEPCINSIKPRMGNEAFFHLLKP